MNFVNYYGLIGAGSRFIVSIESMNLEPSTFISSAVSGMIGGMCGAIVTYLFDIYFRRR